MFALAVRGRWGEGSASSGLARSAGYSGLNGEVRGVVSRAIGCATGVAVAVDGPGQKCGVGEAVG